MSHFATKLPKHKLIYNPVNHMMAHPVYHLQDIQNVKVTHRKVEGFKDRLAYGSVKACRYGIDLISGYNPESMKERNWINRVIFLETITGVPGMIGGMMRHLRSIRTLERDQGWIHNLLNES